MMSVKITSIIFMVFTSFCIGAQEEIRCAVDIGSGWMKMQIASVDPESNNIRAFLGEPLLIYMPLANYFAESGELNEEIQLRAIEAFKDILSVCAEKKVTKLAGVATEVFRKAGISGEKLFNTLRAMAQEQFGAACVCLQLISQELEAELGFLTAAALSPEIDQQKLVSWDSGNASFQMVMKDENNAGAYRIFSGAMGSAPAMKLFIEQIRTMPYQRGIFVNPLTAGEVMRFVEVLQDQLSVPDAFAKEIHRTAMQVVGIGGPTSIFAIAAKALGKPNFIQQELENVLYEYAALPAKAEELKALDANEPETVITRLMLVYSVMQKLHIESISYKASTGNALGILLSPQFWR